MRETLQNAVHQTKTKKNHKQAQNKRKAYKNSTHNSFSGNKPQVSDFGAV
jgi:hypothetical protein